MGHGDEIVIADANFTAASLARRAAMAPLPVIQLPGADVRRTVAAVLELLPLDASVEQPVAYMQVCNTPSGYRSHLQREVVTQLESAGHAQAHQCEAVERFAFYDRVRQAFAIVHTGDPQPYGNFLLRKGVISEALAA
jgi:L-fucose mutarotase